MKSEKNFSALEFFALAFGFFLGVAIWKFGNPVILDHKIIPPKSALDFWRDAWPLHWANWLFLPLAIAGTILILQKQKSFLPNRRLWLLPLVWLGWQFFSATKTVDEDLTAATLWQFSSCIACYFFGAFLFNSRRAQKILFVGILTAFTFCLIRAVDQKLYEFPDNYQSLVESQRNGWTNFPPETVAEMKSENIIITINGTDVANPMILAKFGEWPVVTNQAPNLFHKVFATRPRVSGTLVYPNALAGLMLLLLPVSLAFAFDATKNLKRSIRFAAIALTIFLGGAAFFWTGSKLGWLIGIAVIGIYLFRLKSPLRLKLVTLTIVIVIGLGIFAVRFHNYFAAGATSVGARLDYWRAAAQTTCEHPLLGTGPGTFQRPYARLKSPDAEMARLAHNDYLEQFSDSGIVGGISYAAWIILSLAFIGRRIWRAGDLMAFAIFVGLLGWFAQGFGEFGLYIPALAWTAFTLLGCLIMVVSKSIRQKTGE
jgi:hypothetical protein